MIVLAGGGVLQSSKQSQTPVIKLEPAQIYRVVEKMRKTRKAYKIYTLYKSMHTIPCMHVLPRNRNDDDGACWRGRTPVVRTIKHECIPSKRAASASRLPKGNVVVNWARQNAPKAQQMRRKSVAKTLQRRRKGVARAPSTAQQKRRKGASKAPQKRSTDTVTVLLKA